MTEEDMANANFPQPHVCTRVMRWVHRGDSSASAVFIELRIWEKGTPNGRLNWSHWNSFDLTKFCLVIKCFRRTRLVKETNSNNIAKTGYFQFLLVIIGFVGNQVGGIAKVENWWRESLLRKRSFSPKELVMWPVSEALHHPTQTFSCQGLKIWWRNDVLGRKWHHWP